MKGKKHKYNNNNNNPQHSNYEGHNTSQHSTEFRDNLCTQSAHQQHTRDILNATLTTSSTPQHTTFMAARSLTQENRLCDFDPQLVTTKAHNSTTWRAIDRDPDTISLHSRSHSAHSSRTLLIYNTVRSISVFHTSYEICLVDVIG